MLRWVETGWRMDRVVRERFDNATQKTDSGSSRHEGWWLSRRKRRTGSGRGKEGEREEEEGKWVGGVGGVVER